WGYINARGDFVIPPRFDDVGRFAVNGLARVKVNGKWGYINVKGKEVIKPRFDAASNFVANGLAWVRIGDSRNRREGYIHASHEKSGAIFGEVGDYAANGLAAVRMKGQWGYINKNGEEVIAPRFDDAAGFAVNGLARIKVNGSGSKWSYYGGHWSYGGHWGYINAKGEEVIPPRFDEAEDFAANGLARVEADGKRFCIDAKGEESRYPQ
ncbi:MAG: WG repeat-containing protein, partial [Azoarcus sp.]|nr:WG repeat-containing protein [Azoarcus sp.]